MKPKIILFNAPAKAGKNVTIDYLLNKDYPIVFARCKDSLHELTMKMFNVPRERYWEIYNDRSLKEVPLPEFHIDIDTTEEKWTFESEILKYPLIYAWEPYENHPRLVGNKSGSLSEVNLSIREAMIYVSEIIIKPRFGSDYFGKARVQEMLEHWESLGKYQNTIYVDDSTGFESELPPLIEAVGQENILLIRVHRQGYTFEGDSRNYIPEGVINNTMDIHNNRTEQEYFDKVEEVISKWLV